jgi:hypothetical protein
MADTALFRTYYFDEAVRDLPGVIEDCKRALRGIDFDTIVGTGFSGGIVIPALAMSMGKKFVLIRKENDDSHHGGGKLVGELGERWVFVDDFVSSGRTRERVITKMADAVVGTDLETTTMVGQYMYRRSQSGRFEYFSDDWIPAALKKAHSEQVQLPASIRKGA